MKFSGFASFGRVYAPGKRKLSVSESAGDRFLCVGKERFHFFGFLRERERAESFAAGRLPDEIPLYKKMSQ
jgi:hypothetical protein